MRPISVITGGVSVVVVVAILLVAVVPGILATPEENVRPSEVRVVETTITAGEVTGSTVTLTLSSALSHRGGPAQNLSVHYRAVDLNTGLLATTKVVEVGTVEGTREIFVPTNVTVKREGGYRLRTILYEDGERIQEQTTEIRGVGTLQPEYATTDIGFESFDGATADLPAVEYRIMSVDEERNRTVMNVSAYLSNTGDVGEGDVRLAVRARQVDSGIVADRAEVDVGTIRPGRTVTPTVSLTVPSGYNYYLDATLWRDNVVVGTARAPANLDPTETVPTNTTTREIGLQVGDFDSEDGPTDDEVAQQATEVSSGQPGFGPLAALVALSGGILLARRWF